MGTRGKLLLQLAIQSKQEYESHEELSSVTVNPNFAPVLDDTNAASLMEAPTTIGSNDESILSDFDFSSDSDDLYDPKQDQSPDDSSGINTESESPSKETSPPQEEESPKKKGKKRMRRPETWRKELRKKQKNSGQAYKTARGKVVKERSIKPTCGDRCILKCYSKFSEDSRIVIFEDYWKLASFQRQRDFLGSCIEPLELKYRRVTADASKQPRRQNCAFFLTKEGQRIRVCKTFILNTFSIAERTIRTVIQARASGSGIVPEDKRGKHDKRPHKHDEELLSSVRDHINSIPRIESHYLRASTSREYIDGGLTIAEMHRNYEQTRVSENKSAANYHCYAQIFNNEFNIGFYVPKKDQCDTCEAYKNAIGEEKAQLETEYLSHQEEKNLSRAEKLTDKEKLDAEGSNMVLAVYDLQAVMPVPMGETSSFFYLSRLNCFNFTITKLKSDQTVCYFWHEGLGNRGSNEIGSCVLDFLQNVAISHPGADVIFYSDNCGGQQKNRFVNSMYLYAVQNLQIQSVTHKFLIRGHTQNEGDAAHSVIEKSLKRVKKSGPIYVPEQYISVIRNAKKHGNPLKVKEMNYSNFFDLKTLADDMRFNHQKNSEGETIKLSNIKMLRFVKGSDVYFYKTSYKDSDWVAAPVTTTMLAENSDAAPGPRRSLRSALGSASFVPKESGNRSRISLKPAYHSKLRLPDKKKDDLMKLLNKNMIPKIYEPFYQAL